MGTGGSYNPPSTGGGEISTTYAALMALQAANELTPGQQYSFPFKTIHWLVDANGNYCNDLVDAPAPGNITITPDAVGANPVTWYYVICYIDDVGETRSLFTAESTFQVGDSTTEVILNCDAIPSWANNLFIAAGLVSATYPDADNNSSLPYDIFSVLGNAGGLYDTVNGWLIHQVVDEGLTPTRSIIEGAEETLVVTATSTNTLAKIAYSVDYPQDYIEYCLDFNALNLMPVPQLYDISEETYIPDYRGTITRRRDTLGNDLGWDTNSVKYRRWSITQPAWDSETTYNAGDTVLAMAMGVPYAIMGAKIESTDIEPIIDEGWETYWEILIVPAVMGYYLSPVPDEVEINGYTLTIQDATDFQDVLALGEGSVNNVQLTGFNIFPFIVLPAYSRFNVFNSEFDVSPIFWQPVFNMETVTHHSTNGGVARQTYIDGSDNSMVIGEGMIGMEVGG